MDIHQFSFKNLFKKNSEFKWYYALIYLLVFAVPFNHKEAFSVYDPDLVWSKYILGALAIVGVYFLTSDYKKYIKDPFFLFLISFVLFQVFSLTQTRDFASSIRLIGFQGAIAFAYIPIKNFITERKNSIRDLVLVYAVTFILVFLFLLVQVYLQTRFETAIGGVWPVRGYPTRYGSTFWDINHFGAFCSALTLILLGYILNKGLKLRSKVFAGLILLSLLISLYLTSSRSSMAGFAVGLIVFLILNIKEVKVKVSEQVQNILIYLSTLIATSGFLLFIYFFADSIRSALLYRSTSFFSHLFLLKVGIIVGFQHFLFGIGANSFHAYFRDTEWADIYYFIDRAALDLKLPLHNLWLEVLAETGVVSLIFFIAFWLLLLFGLYRTYIKTNDKVAIGFLAGITSFLVGGVMYSYKSEFFWLFVLIGAAYVARTFFIDAKLKIVDTIKDIICSGRCDFIKAILFILSLLVLAFPIFYVVQPLNEQEINMFYGGFKPNFISDIYTDILVLFRYVIGNYSYTGRLVSIIFYSGSIVLAYLLLKRYIGIFYSFIFLSLIFGVTNIFEPNLVVSIKWFLTFGLLSVATLLVIILSFLNRRIEAFRIDNVKLNIVLIGLFMGVISYGAIANNNFFKRSYPNDLFSLMELAYNRGFLNGSLVQVGDSINLNSIYFFVDNVEKDSEGLYILEGVVVPVSGFDLNNYEKDIFIYSNSDSNLNDTERFINLLREDTTNEITELSQGEYKIVLIERTNPAPL